MRTPLLQDSKEDGVTNDTTLFIQNAGIELIATHTINPDLDLDQKQDYRNIEQNDSKGLDDKLESAVKTSNFTLASELIRSGANANSRDAFYRALLATALEIHHPEIIRLLVSLHPEGEKLSKIFTPSMVCSAAKSKEILELITTIDVDIDIADKDGNTALHCAAGFYTNEINTMKNLILFGANINAENNDGMTPLHNAVNQNKNSTSVVKLFLENGADLTKENKDGKTPFEIIRDYRNRAIRSEIYYYHESYRLLKEAGNECDCDCLCTIQ